MTAPWVGMVHVRPIRGADPLNGGRGAYSNILALANDAESYKAAVLGEMGRQGLAVVEFAEIDTVQNYLAEGRIGGELEELEALLSNDNPVQYRTFDAYFSDDA